MADLFARPGCRTCAVQTPDNTPQGPSLRLVGIRPRVAAEGSMRRCSVAPVSASNVPGHQYERSGHLLRGNRLDWPAITDRLQWPPRITARNGNGDVVNISTIRFFFI